MKYLYTSIFTLIMSLTAPDDMPDLEKKDIQVEISGHRYEYENGKLERIRLYKFINGKLIEIEEIEKGDERFQEE